MRGVLEACRLMIPRREHVYNEILNDQQSDGYGSLKQCIAMCTIPMEVVIIGPFLAAG